MATETSTQDLFRLDNRTIILTGGLGGIGIPLIAALLESGADIAVTDLQADPPREDWESLKTLATSHSLELTYHRVDVTSAESVKDTFTQIQTSARNPIRGLVCLAGVSQRHDAIDYPQEEFRRILDINVTGTMLACQAGAKAIMEAGLGGSIVIFASMSGWVVNQGVNTSAYNTSKSALHQLARSLAAEWGTHTHPSSPPIRVNTISPGYVKTVATGPTLDALPGLRDMWERGNMLGRLAEAEELRGPVVFLLGDGSSYVTGTDLRVDGGHCGW
ncbi:MAG: hypothetical protein Q9227_005623 [Pyrenula ochraceoflavens]